MERRYLGGKPLLGCQRVSPIYGDDRVEIDPLRAEEKSIWVALEGGEAATVSCTYHEHRVCT